GHVFLIEAFPFYTIWKPIKRLGPVFAVRQYVFSHLSVIVEHVALGVSSLRPKNLLKVCEFQLIAISFSHLRLCFSCFFHSNPLFPHLRFVVFVLPERNECWMPKHAFIGHFGVMYL